MKLSSNAFGTRQLKQFGTESNRARSRRRLARAAGTTVSAIGTLTAGLFSISAGYGATITTTGNDAIGASSFLSGTVWSDGNAPSAANDYIVLATDQIRTPTTGTLFTFAGNSLTLGDGTATGYGILTFKGQIGDTLTINNFTLNSGIIQTGGTSGGTANPWTLASAENITVGAGGFAVDNGATAARTVTIAANLVGSGALEVINNTRTPATATNSINGGSLILTGSNTLWTGSVLIRGGVLQIGNGGAAGTLGTGALAVDAPLVFDVTANQTYTQAISVDTGTSGTISNISTGSIALSSVTVNGALTLSNTSTAAATGAITFSGAITETSTNALGITNALGNIVIAGGIAGGGGAITVTNGGGLVSLGAVTGAGALTVGGTGTTRLSGASTYTGNTTVNGGSLIVTAGGNIPASNNWTVASGAILDVSAGTGTLSTTSAGSISGSGTIVGNSNGVVSQGTFSPGPGATIGTLTVNGHLTFTGGTINTTLNAASTATGNDFINVTGTGAGLTLNGSIFLNPTFVGGTPTVGSQYEIVGYTGSLSGTGAIVPQNRSIQIITTTPGEIIAQITTAAAANLVWNSTSNQNWDIVSTVNWHNTGSNQNDVFYQGDNVTFNDSTPSVQSNINIAAQVAPGSVTVNSTGNNYVFGGTGGITGGTAVNITLGVSNSLTITSNNTYSGGTTINSGLVKIGTGTGVTTSGTLGSSTITNNGTLLFARSDQPNFSNVIAGNGTIEFGDGGSNASGGGTLSGSNTYTGQTIINSGTVFPGNNNAFGAATSTVTINTNGQLFSTMGTGVYPQQIQLNGLGPTSTVATGVLHAGGSTTSTFSGGVVAIGNSIVNVDGGATLALTNTNALTSPNGSSVESFGAGALGLGGNMNLNGGELFAGVVNLIPAAGITNTLSSPIADNSPTVGTINENGAATGTTVLAVDNSYSGTTTITNGVLEPQSANAIPSTSTIFIVGNAALGSLGLTAIGITNITNALSINGRPATNTPDILNISGNNTVSGTMTGNTGGSFYDFESDSGTLTVTGTLTTPTSGIRGVALTAQSPGVGNWTSPILLSGSATISLIKNGTGTWLISNGASTYSGGTTINQGTLVINAASGALGTGNVTMAGGVLASQAGATDAVAGSVVDGATASYTVAPGGVGTIGTLAIGGLTTTSLGTLSFDLGSGAAPHITNGDVLTLGSGTVSIGSGTLLSVGGTPVLGDDYRLIGDTSSGSVVNAIPLANFTLPAAPAGLAFTLSTAVDSGFIDLVVSSGGPANLTWNNGAATGLWNSVDSNWNNGTSNATYSDGSQVTFNDNNGGNYGVTLNTTVSPASVAINNSGGSYVIGGSGSIAGTAALSKSGSGVATLNSVNTYSGGTNVSAGTLVVGVHGALPSGAVSITGGAVQLAASTGGATVTSLSVTGGGKFDVNNNHLVINYGTPANDPASAVRTMLISGYNNGAWNGPGIDSSAAAAIPGYALGYADAADPGNPAGLASGTIEVEYTLIGDADLNRTVNGIDFGILAANFNKTVTAWDQGDFDYNGIVNGIDFTALASNFNKATSGASAGATAADFAALEQFAAANGLLADVPEPTTAALVTLTALGVLGRRRRRSS
jgi:autotransporter-associated beta strand protein